MKQRLHIRSPPFWRSLICNQCAGGYPAATPEKEKPMFEKILIGLIVAGAVYYLYRRFRATTSADGASCGCGGCDSCGTAQIACQANGSDRSKEEKNEK
jgi:hypothetical protein